MPTRDEVMTHAAIQRIPKQLTELAVAVPYVGKSVEEVEATLAVIANELRLMRLLMEVQAGILHPTEYAATAPRHDHQLHGSARTQ